MLSRFVLGIILLGSLSSAFAAAEETYVVQRGDTLTSIARQFGVSVSALAARNDISKNQFVTTGQRLTIPSSGKGNKTAGAPATSAIPGLPKPVKDALANAPVRSGRWKYIVVHHSGVDEGTLRAMDRYHREVRHMEHGLAYHFVIGNGHGMGDGEIAVGDRWKQQLDGGHLRSEEQNKIALGICLVGNFDQDSPTPKQMQSLNALVQALMKRCGVPPSGVKTHQQINIIGTRCPGKKFPTNSFLSGLRTPR